MSMQPSPPPAPNAEPAHVPYLVEPLRDLDAWTRYFQTAEIPVLSSTSRRIEALRGDEDNVDANMLGEVIDRDPLMTLKLMALVASKRRPGTVTETESVTTSLVMMGITPFFRVFGPQPTVEEHLASRPEALEGFRRVLKRSHRAANFAIGFAVHRFDHDAPVIHEAALLHDFAEMLLWLRAPSLALEIARRQQADPTLRSADVQKQVLNVELHELQHALMLRWRLPALLIRITDHHQHNDSAQVRNVLLAIRVARHSADSWDNAALPDDVSEIASLLQMGVEPTWKLLREIDG